MNKDRISDYARAIIIMIVPTMAIFLGNVLIYSA